MSRHSQAETLWRGIRGDKPLPLRENLLYFGGYRETPLEPYLLLPTRDLKIFSNKIRGIECTWKHWTNLL